MKKHHWHAFWHEKLFKKQSQLHYQTRFKNTHRNWVYMLELVTLNSGLSWAFVWPMKKTQLKLLTSRICDGDANSHKIIWNNLEKTTHELCQRSHFSNVLKHMRAQTLALRRYSSFCFYAKLFFIP
jgi:hypothetical protein